MFGEKRAGPSLWRRWSAWQALKVQEIWEFERTARRSERLARQSPPPREPTEFEALVAESIDRLPEQFQRALAEIPVVVTDGGNEWNAYGLYQGDTIVHDHHPDRILIFQDTLERDFGHDRDLLMAQVERTVRHELAHHLGWDERGVANLGL
ncbi:MAG: metallopeptidase family protein [Solirubrobacterales bacterium]